MKKVGSYEAKTKLPELLKLVSSGQSFTITLRGEPIAVLSPYKDSSLEERKAAIEAIKNLCKGIKLGKVSLKSLIDDGRA